LDVLFNAAVTNATHHCPVLVWRWAKPLNDTFRQVGGLEGCLAEVGRLFGGSVPLRYTTSFFRMEESYGTSTPYASLRKHKCADVLPPEA